MTRLASVLLTLALSACAGTAAVKPPPAPAAATPAAPQAAHDPRLRAAPPAPALASPLVMPLDEATRAALPRESVTASAHGHVLECEGVPLSALLRANGALPAEPLRGEQLSRYVLVTARDGYRVVYSLAELDPSLSQQRVLLVDRCHGKPLDTHDGPLRLIAPGDVRPARWLRQVKSITVIAAP